MKTGELDMSSGELEWVAVVVAVVTVVVRVVDGYRRHVLLTLGTFVLWLVLAVLLIVGVIEAFRRWRRMRWRVIVPIATVVGGFLLQYPAEAFGLWYRERAFLRVLPAYEQVVEQFRSGTQGPGALPLDSLPTVIRECCYLVVGGRDSAGDLVVEFYTDRAFPVHHAAWTYYPGTSSQRMFRDHGWYYGYRVSQNWWRVGD